MSRITPARDLFNRLQSLDNDGRFALVEAMTDPADPQFEGDYLEFKRPPSELPTDPKWTELWLKALSGFANADGGVLIWGVKATQNPVTKVNAAETLVLVLNPLAVKSRLVQLLPDATNPTIGNVEILTIDSPKTVGRGLVVCFIPAGHQKPYCTREGGKDARYYIRMGESTLPMSRALLQTLFYPEQTAQYEIALRLEYRDPKPVNKPKDSYDHHLDVKVAVRNAGRRTAKNVLIAVKSDLPGKLGRVLVLPEFTRVKTSDKVLSFQSKHSIHPETSNDVATISWDAIESVFTDSYIAKRLRQIEVVVNSDDQEPQSAALTVSQEKIILLGPVEESVPTK